MFRNLIIAASLFVFSSSPSLAQNAVPELPAPIQNLVDEGAQIRYLGKDHGLDAWLTVKNGVEQYFYVLPNQEAFMMGVLFDNDGKVVTVHQVERLRGKGDALLDDLAEFPTTEEEQVEDFELKSPAEQMFSDLENSNWVALGRPGAPVVYSFIDPQCPHCHQFIEDLRNDDLLAKGQVQVRMIPVGFREQTQAQAAFLIAAPDPQARWLRHMDGDPEALPAKDEINRQGVQRNLAIMQAWKFDVTPLIVYRGKDDKVKIVRGKPQDLGGMVRDLKTAG